MEVIPTTSPDSYKRMRYNIYIVKKSGGAEVLAGKEVSEHRADRYVMAVLSKVNDDYFVADVEVGSEEDKKYATEVESHKTK